MAETVDILIELIEAVRWPLTVIVVALILRKGLTAHRDRKRETSETEASS